MNQVDPAAVEHNQKNGWLQLPGDVWYHLTVNYLNFREVSLLSGTCAFLRQFALDGAVGNSFLRGSELAPTADQTWMDVYRLWLHRPTLIALDVSGSMMPEDSNLGLARVLRILEERDRSTRVHGVCCLVFADRVSSTVCRDGAEAIEWFEQEHLEIGRGSTNLTELLKAAHIANSSFRGGLQATIPTEAYIISDGGFNDHWGEATPPQWINYSLQQSTLRPHLNIVGDQAYDWLPEQAADRQVAPEARDRPKKRPAELPIEQLDAQGYQREFQRLRELEEISTGESSGEQVDWDDDEYQPSMSYSSD